MNASLLIVDGNKRHRERICAFFSSREYSTFQCSTHNEALHLLQDHGFDIAIVDYTIGQTTGDELCEFLASSCKELTSLIITNSVQSPEIEKRIRSFSPVFYFIKPFPINDLHAVIVKTLEYRNRNMIIHMNAVAAQCTESEVSNAFNHR